MFFYSYNQTVAFQNAAISALYGKGFAYTDTESSVLTQKMYDVLERLNKNQYLNLIINEHKCGQNYTIRELSYFPDGGIKGLIYHKISKVEENNIKYFLFIDKNIKDIFEEKFDLKTYQDITKLLGVFLDNAIEATMLSNKKEVEIDFKKQDDCIIMDISNTFNNFQVKRA